MALLDDIVAKLRTDSLVEGATGWEVSLSYMPPDQDKMIAVYETGGAVPDQTQDTKYDFPSFQVRGRADKFRYDLLRTKMQEIFDSLNDSTISGYVYVYAVTSGPLPIGYDVNLRPEMTWNFETMKAR